MLRPPHVKTTHRLVSAALAASALALALAACSGSGQDASPRSNATSAVAGRASTTGAASSTSAPSSAAASSSPASSAAASSSADTEPVHVQLYNADGAHYGVGMPVIAYFSRRITDASAFQRATSVTANGKPLQAAWYFENSGAGKGPIEAHLRPESYWPAHADIHVALPVTSLSAGGDMRFDDNLTLDFSTGAATIATVSDAKHTLTLTEDGKTVGTYPVSLGGPGSRTIRGTKVVMEQDKDTRMQGDHGGIEYDLAHVYWTQRLTYSGEYLHAAPWNEPRNGGVIGSGDSSNGCTNLSTADARTLFRAMEPGDVVRYPDATGPKMTLSDGFGDWNVSWAKWQTGGLVPTT